MKRPFSKTEALHITLRSDNAKGGLSMAQKPIRTWLNEYMPYLANRCRIRLYSWSNNGNHLHLVLKANEARDVSAFLRVLCGMIARRVLKAEKGAKSTIRFWNKRPYSRIVSWGREYWNVLRYVERNVLEAKGQLRYRKRQLKESDVVKDELMRRVILNQRSRRDGA